MESVLDRLLPGDDGAACRCSVAIEESTVDVDATDCDGDLGASPACRATVARAVAGTDATRLRVRTRGVDRFYDRATLDLLAAAGRFAELARDAAPRLAERAPREPLETARDAAARASPVDEIAAEAGLLDAATDADAPFEPAVAPSIGHARVAAAPPTDGRLRTVREPPSGATVRVYDVPDRGADTYHVEPVETTLDAAALETVAEAAEVLAERDDEPTPVRAVRSALDGDAPDEDTAGEYTADEDTTGEDASGNASVRTLAAVLRKYTRGYGVLEDLFADPAVSDVYASGPATETPLRVVADGEHLRTNVTLSADGVGAIASRLRRESGRAFSRASPTVDATATIADRRVRVAGVVEPATDGHAFAFRAGGEAAFTLPALVANGTITPDAAGLLSVAVRRGVAGLIAGTRGAGKTTLLGALLWELPATTRTVVVEDTPELPVETLQRHGRDVQPLRTTLEDGPGVTPTTALRTALRLGESALVLGEVRGEEAAVLYEAMRVGAGGETVLGTIHGDGGEDIRERVVSDLGVPASSFAATDLVVTCQQRADDEGSATGDAAHDSSRRVAAIEEARADGAGFASLFEVGPDGLAPTGRVDRGNSRLLQALARPDERYADVRARVQRRAALVENLAERGTTDPAAVAAAYANYGERSW